MPYTVNSTAETVGEALRQAEVILYLGDRVQPSLGSRVTANMHVLHPTERAGFATCRWSTTENP